MGTMIVIAVLLFIYLFFVIRFPNRSMEEFKDRISQMKADLQKKEEERVVLQGQYQEAAVYGQQLREDILHAHDEQKDLLQLKEEWKQKHEFVSNQKLHENQALYFASQVPEEELHKEDFDLFNWTSPTPDDSYLHNEPFEQTIESGEQQPQDLHILAAEMVNDTEPNIGTDMIRDETDHGMVNGMGFHLHDPQNQPDPFVNLNDSEAGNNAGFPDNAFPEEPIDSLPDDGFVDISIMDEPPYEEWDMPDNGMDLHTDEIDDFDGGLDMYDSAPDDPYHY
ncbi:hypothetical protein [Virgibacillus senegalensis]|uniref:hypothetical protein n=1 Tax=Virgibacillus senegalensis TaxID=1499679 RepID=UPI00069F1532|nr:hypothetical protein [Virgibacillus senegalensis]